MTTRRRFLTSFLLLGAAPAIVTSSSLMKVVYRPHSVSLDSPYDWVKARVPLTQEFIAATRGFVSEGYGEYRHSGNAYYDFQGRIAREVRREMLSDDYGWQLAMRSVAERQGLDIHPTYVERAQHSAIAPKHTAESIRAMWPHMDNLLIADV